MNKESFAHAGNEDLVPDGADRPQPDLSRVYKTAKGTALNLHFFLPKKAPSRGSAPACVFFHGGAWRKGSPAQFFGQCRYLADRGMVCCSAEYRLCLDNGIRVADCVADAKAAVRYLRVNARELRLDPNRIVAGGGSAGGHLAAATAVSERFDEENERRDISCQPDLLVLFNPALFHPLGQNSLTPEEMWKLRRNTWMVYGSDDAMVEYGKQCAAQLPKGLVRLMIASGVGHGFFNKSPWKEKTIRSVERFLAKHRYVEDQAGQNVEDDEDFQ